jgi:hypothetical protein
VLSGSEGNSFEDLGSAKIFHVNFPLQRLETRRFNRLTPNDLQRCREERPLKIKIPSKQSRQAALRGGI